MEGKLDENVVPPTYTLGRRAVDYLFDRRDDPGSAHKLIEHGPAPRSPAGEFGAGAHLGHHNEGEHPRDASQHWGPPLIAT